MNFAHRLHIILVIGKYTDVFKRIFSGGGGGVYAGGSIHGGILWGKGIFKESGAVFISII